VTSRLKQLLFWGVVLAGFAAGCGGRGELGAKALSQHSRSLESGAAEGALLAEDASSGRTTDIYLHEHSADLIGAISREKASLTKAAAEPELEPKLRTLRGLAVRVGAELRQLPGASRDRQRALGRELGSAADELDRIGKGLDAA
jgi:hypothetical protein